MNNNIFSKTFQPRNVFSCASSSPQNKEDLVVCGTNTPRGVLSQFVGILLKLHETISNRAPTL